MAIDIEKTRAGAEPFSLVRAWRGLSELHRGVILRTLSVVVTLVAWEWYGRGVDPIFMSYPTAIVAAAPRMLATAEFRSAIWVSLQGLLSGLALAVVTGVSLGLLTGRYRTVDYLTDVQMTALYSTPHVALLPLLMLWFGIGSGARIALIYLSAFFPIVINTQSGVRNIGHGLIEVALAEGASERQIFTKIVVPAALPFIMTGIRLAMGRGVVAMVVAEMVMTAGLGGAIQHYGMAFATDRFFVVLVVLALLGVGLTELARVLERRLTPWKQTERAR
jgi:ABC-type nitrate/sulfonate/bicarbonate transport system permease component